MHRLSATSSLFVILFAMCLFSMSPDAESQPGQADAPAATTPQWTADGRVVAGTKSIRRKPDWPQIDMNIDVDALGSFAEMFDLGKGALHTVFFMNSQVSQEPSGSFYTSEIRDSTSSDVKLGTYRQNLSLLDNGLVEIKCTAELDDPSLLKDRYAILNLPSYLTLKGVLVRDGQTIPVDGDQPVSFTAEQLKGAELHLFPDKQQRSLTLRFPSSSKITISGSLISLWPADNHELRLLIDLRGSGEAETATAGEPTVNGVDLWSVDGLHLPAYAASRNLIQNPSFEAGLRYWGFPIFVGGMIPLEYQGVYVHDDAVARTGSSSLRLRALPMKSPLTIGHNPTPFIPGKPYVYSFYAKASPGRTLRINVWGRGMIPQVLPGTTQAFSVTDEWQRITVPFEANQRFACIYLDAMDPEGESGGETAYVWVDDVQLEQASEATEFVDVDVAAELVSAARGNFLEFGQTPEFALNLRSLPRKQGSVNLAVENFYFDTVFEGSYSFTTDADGWARIDLGDLDAWLTDTRSRGVFIARADIEVEGLDRSVREFFRFSAMDFLENKHKRKDLFNLTYAYSVQAGGPEMERFVQRERAIGFGSITYDFVGFALDWEYDLDRERMELLKEYGFGNMGRAVLQLHSGEEGEISEKQGELKMSGIKQMIDPTDEQLQRFEDIVAVKAEMRPWNDIWWFTGESNPGVMPLEAHHDAYAKFLLATYRGVKRGNPEADVLIEGGPWSIEPQYGTKWVERYIQDTRRLDPSVEFDGAAGHHYRNFPESPDLDSDITAFLEMLDRNGHEDWPFYINEGGNYIPFNIPQEGISPYIVQSGNAWYMGPLSYHFGWAERISAAFSARNWLIGLKHGDRVPCMQDFNTSQRYVDFDLTPRPYDKIPNTLGRLLGNSTFYRDIRFAPETRCYVFTDDPTGRVVAAMWGHRQSVDRGKEEAPLYRFDFAELEVEFVDLMENSVAFPRDSEGLTTIPLSPFPVFIVSPPGTADALCEAIGAAVPASDERSAIELVAMPTGDGAARLSIRNTLDRPTQEQVTVSLNGKTSEITLELAALEEATHSVPLPSPSDSSGPAVSSPRTFDLTCTAGGQTLAAVKGQYLVVPRRAGAGQSPDSRSVDWSKVPAAALSGEHSLRVLADDEALWLCLERPADGNAQRPDTSSWEGTGLYFAPMIQPQDWHVPKTMRQDLGVFELQESTAGKLEAMCHYVQGTQAGSGTSLLRADTVQHGIEVMTQHVDQRERLVLRVRKEVLAPFVPGAGAFLGCNITLPSPANGTTGPVSLSPVQGYVSPREPGELTMTLLVLEP